MNLLSHRCGTAGRSNEFYDALELNACDVLVVDLAVLAVIYGAITDWTLDFKAMGPVLVESIRQALEQTLVNPLIDDPRIVHVDFRTLRRDPIAVIEEAYDGWGKRVTPEFAGRMRAWLSDPANRSDRYGRYPYSLEAFGLSAKLLESSFAAYRDRFGLNRGRAR